ncbi:hypothetical protein [Nocardia sp. CC227C]|uniref:hypothetical protein n=1 Tax=Nocardia sp. CC227C TaxID=3044562 RepID=UPI00278BDCCA|nr:hypothetical protein [Nocardia sp. CC227C]
MRRSSQATTPLPFMMLTGLIAFTGFRDSLGAGTSDTIVLSLVLLVQIAGIAAGWRRAPTGTLRLSIGAAFATACIAVGGLLLVGTFGESDAATSAQWIFYPLIIFGLALQGYYLLWRGRS